MRPLGWILLMLSAPMLLAAAGPGSGNAADADPLFLVEPGPEQAWDTSDRVIEVQRIEEPDDPEEPVEPEDSDDREDSERESEADRAWLGVELQDLDEALREAFDFEGPGVLVGEVVPGSPADRAGIEKGDIIVRVDGRQVGSPAQVVSRIRTREPGDRVKITCIRKGREKKVEAKLVETPERLGLRRPWESRQPGGYLGARTSSLGPDLAPYFDVQSESGALVIEVEEDSPAERAGLKAGDVISQVDGERVRSAEDLLRAIHDQDPGSKVILTAIRHGKEQRIEATLAAAPPSDRLRHLARLRGDLAPMLHGLHDRMREGRDALSGRIEKLEEMMRDLERRLDELGDRKER